MEIQLSNSAVSTFRLRGLSPTLVQMRVAMIQRVLGMDFVRQLASKPIEDVVSTAIICERSSILGELIQTPGLAAVTKDILTDPKRSLVSPEGQWFQLLVAGTLFRRGNDVALEQNVSGSAPKDIVIPEHQIQIECKAFQSSTALQRLWQYQSNLFELIEDSLPTGSWQLALNFDSVDGPLKESTSTDIVQFLKRRDVVNETTRNDNFTFGPSDRQSEPYGNWPDDAKMVLFGSMVREPMTRFPYSLCQSRRASLFIEGPHLDEFKRLHDALVDKRRQMIPGWINLLAIDVEDLCGDFHHFKNYLVDMLRGESFDVVSGFLFVHRSLSQHYTHVRIELIQNPTAAQSIPVELIDRLSGEVYWS